MQRVRRQLAVGQHGSGQPFLRFRPPTSPQRVRPEPVRSRGPSPRRKSGVISNRFKRLLPIRPRLDRRRTPYCREPVRERLKRLPRNPRELFGRFPGLPNRARQQNKDGSGRNPGPSPRWRRRLGTPTSGRHAGRRPAERVSLLPRKAPPAWNAPVFVMACRLGPPVFRPARGPQARRARLAAPPHGAAGLERSGLRDGVPAGTAGLQTGTRAAGPQSASRCSPAWRPRLGTPTSGRHRPLSGRNCVCLNCLTGRGSGTPTPGRHRAGARNPPRWHPASHNHHPTQPTPILKVPPTKGPFQPG